LKTNPEIAKKGFFWASLGLFLYSKEKREKGEKMKEKNGRNRINEGDIVWLHYVISRIMILLIS